MKIYSKITLTIIFLFSYLSGLSDVKVEASSFNPKIVWSKQIPSNFDISKPSVTTHILANKETNKIYVENIELSQKQAELYVLDKTANGSKKWTKEKASDTNLYFDNNNNLILTSSEDNGSSSGHFFYTGLNLYSFTKDGELNWSLFQKDLYSDSYLIKNVTNSIVLQTNGGNSKRFQFLDNRYGIVAQDYYFSTSFVPTSKNEILVVAEENKGEYYPNLPVVLETYSDQGIKIKRNFLNNIPKITYTLLNEENDKITSIGKDKTGYYGVSFTINDELLSKEFLSPPNEEVKYTVNNSKSSYIVFDDYQNSSQSRLVSLSFDSTFWNKMIDGKITSQPVILDNEIYLSTSKKSETNQYINEVQILNQTGSVINTINFPSSINAPLRLAGFVDNNTLIAYSDDQIYGIEIDTSIPSAPIVNPIGNEDKVLTGLTEKGATVFASIDGVELGNTSADSEGRFKIDIPKLKEDTIVKIEVVGVNGQKGPSTYIKVDDKIPPEIPTVNEVTDQTTHITGTAEADSVITAKIGENVIGKSVTGKDGQYSLAIELQKSGSTIIITSKDAAGNISKGQGVIVKDVTAPTIPSVDDLTDNSTIVTGTAEIGTNITLKTGSKVLGIGIVDESGHFSIAISKQLAGTKIIVTSTDKAGNVSEEKAVIVKDIEQPIFSGIVDSTINIGDDFDALTGISATDNEDGDITSQIRVSGAINTAKPKTFTLTYSVLDKAGNVSIATRKITVIDSINPVIMGTSNKNIAMHSSFNSMDGIYALDNIDGVLTENIEVTGTVNVKEIGSYTLTYSISDKAGNRTTVVRTITVYDNIKPVITGATNKSININSTFNPLTGVTATDNVDRNLTSSIKVAGTVNPKEKGTYILTYTVRDKSGNETIIKRIITVIDNVKPVISGATNKTINLNTSFNPKSGVTAKDNVDGVLTNAIKITGTVNTKKRGTYTITYTVSDKTGNKAVVYRKITVN